MVETKRAAHRFSAIRVRPLNDPRQCSLPHLHEVQTAASVTIRLLILTLVNGLAPSELRRMFCSDEGAYVRGGLNDLH